MSYLLAHSGGGHTGDYLLPYYLADYFPDGLDWRGGGSFKPDSAGRIAQGICEGLEVLHGAEPKVLHLDLNPGNIRLTGDGRPVITDFGVARTEGPRPVEVTGPPPFYPGVAAPEQLAGEEPDERTDIYQLGSLLCWMLIGHYPNIGGIPNLIARRDIPPYLKETVLKCVDASRERRFQDVASLKTALVTAIPEEIEPGVFNPGWRSGKMVDALRTLDRAKLFSGKLTPPWWRLPTVAVGVLLPTLAVAWVVGLLPPYGPVEITVVSSSTKQEWFADVVELFNKRSEQERTVQYRRNSMQMFGRSIKPARKNPQLPLLLMRYGSRKSFEIGS